MKKISFFKFLIRFIVANLFSLFVYIILIWLIDMLSGGSVTIMSGAYESSGWSAEDVSVGLRVFLRILLLVAYFLMVGLFYLFFYLKVARNKETHDDFLKTIEAKPFNREEFSKEYIKSGAGKYEIKYFIIIIAVGAIVTVLGIPFFTLIMISQSTASDIFTSFIPLSGVLRRIVEAVIMVVVNIPMFYLFQAKIMPRLFEKWASQRLRIEYNN